MTNPTQPAAPKFPIPLGVPDRPWPTMIRGQKKVGTDIVNTLELGVIEDPHHPLLLHSDRPYAEVAGEFYRNMPVPSMLPALEFLISRSHPEQINRVANLVSDPGTGKSFLAILVGKVRDSRGPIVTDAGGKNLEYLLFETVFDVSASRSLTQAIDEGLANNSLAPVSLNALRKLGKHFSEQGGRASIDWNGLVQDQDITTETIRSTLELVRTVEQWDAGKMGIGFKTKEGPLVQAHREGRDLIIDEVNKGKPGSETPLQIVWQVLNGEIEKHTVTLGGNGEFTFERDRTDRGMVVCTGNLPKDGVGTHLISESFDRRVPGYRISNFDEGDWQHRICQKLTGLPISTLHRMQKGSWKKNKAGKDTWVVDDPQQFTQLLFNLRTLGLSAKEKANIPQWQMSMISNWQGVLQASERLAQFYHQWSQLVDPESPVLKTSMPEVLAEVESPDEPTPKVTPSTMIRNIQDAVQLKPISREIEHSGGFNGGQDWNTPPSVTVLDREAPESNLGSRLATIIMDEVERNSQRIGKPQLYKHLREHAKNAGLLGDKAAIPKLLNVDVSKLPSAPTDAGQMQKALAALLRAEHPQLKLSDDDEQVLPLRQVESAMSTLAQEAAAGHATRRLSAHHNVMHVPNTDPDTAQGHPVKRIVTDSLLDGEQLREMRNHLPPDKLESRLAVLASFTLPGTGEMNQNALWNQSFTKGADPGDGATAIAQNQSGTEFATTSVICRGDKDGKAGYTKLHVVRNNKLKRTLVVGEGEIPTELRQQLKRKGIAYVDQNATAAESMVTAEIRAMMDATQESMVAAAFMLRNWQKGEGQLPKSLASLMTGQDTALMVPHFITAMDPEKAPLKDRISRSTGGKAL